MDWQQLLNRKRLGNRGEKDESGRTAFLRDHDKIIFSGAFRRLARKTQVHPLATNDHVHNRLTHSLEVSCVGRTLGIRVGERLQARGLLPDNVAATDPAVRPHGRARHPRLVPAQGQGLPGPPE